MAEMDRQLVKPTSKEARKQVEEQMKNVRKQIEDAEKMMEQDRLKWNEHREAPCTGDCGNAPQ